jgi:RNA polymerase sigma-70 factor (ECF subfamily)
MGMAISSSLDPSVQTTEARWTDGADLASVAVLQERYLRDVYRYVLRRVPRQDEAEDITAEVFASAFAGLSRFRGECPPHLWLLTIARRKIIDTQRRRAARRETLASELADEDSEGAEIWHTLPAADQPEAVLTRAEARRVLRGLIAGLTAEQQEALSLKYWEGLSIDEIAVVMGRSPGSVTSLLHRARASLFRRGRGYFLGDDEDERHD